MSNPIKGLRPSLMFAPFVADLPDGGQILVQVWVEVNKETSEWSIESVYICHRSDGSDSWSPAIKTARP